MVSGIVICKPLKYKEMRNIVFVLVVLFFGLFFLSCSKKEQKVGPGISKVILDTTYFHTTQPKLATRHSCSGQILKEPKLVGWKLDTTEKHSSVLCNFSHEELMQMGYTYTGKEDNASRPVKFEEEESALSSITPTPRKENREKKQSDSFFSQIPWYLLWWLGFLGIGVAFSLVILWLLTNFVGWLFSQRLPAGNQNPPQNQAGGQNQQVAQGPVPAPQGNNPTNQGSAEQVPTPQGNNTSGGTYIPDGYSLIPKGYGLYQDGTTVIAPGSPFNITLGPSEEELGDNS